MLADPYRLLCTYPIFYLIIFFVSLREFSGKLGILTILFFSLLGARGVIGR
jgi:hypothetical protein